jgi:hypothetical protein
MKIRPKAPIVSRLGLSLSPSQTYSASFDSAKPGRVNVQYSEDVVIVTTLDKVNVVPDQVPVAFVVEVITDYIPTPFGILVIEETRVFAVV